MCDNCHVVAVRVEIRNIDALEKAATRLGGELRRGQKEYKWYGKWVNDYHEKDAAYKHGVAPTEYGKCAHAIHFDDCAYEVGVIAKDDGSFTLVWDFIDARLSNTLGGPQADRLVQAYTVEAARAEAAHQGATVTEEHNEDGSILLTCTHYA